MTALPAMLSSCRLARVGQDVLHANQSCTEHLLSVTEPNACSPFVFTISTIYILIYFQLQKENRVQSIILIKKIYLTACVLAPLLPLFVLSGFPGYSWPPEEAYCPNTSLLPPLTPHSSVDLHPAALRCCGEIKRNGKSITKCSSTLELKMSMCVRMEHAVHRFIRRALPIAAF